jgi:hypothetical protein
VRERFISLPKMRIIRGSLKRYENGNKDIGKKKSIK